MLRRVDHASEVALVAVVVLVVGWVLVRRVLRRRGPELEDHVPLPGVGPRRPAHRRGRGGVPQRVADEGAPGSGP